jgi:tetratricopeptide (TPR) repeat protein
VSTRVAGRAPRGARLAAGLLALAAATGCRNPGAFPPGADQPLSESDRESAQALASYLRGLLQEALPDADPHRILREYTQAARLDPARRRLQSKLAVAALHADRRDVAVSAFQQMVQLEPTSVVARTYLASAYQLAGQTNEAARTHREIIALQPRRTLSHWEAARFHLSLRHDPEALALLAEGFRLAAEPDTLEELVREAAATMLRAQDLRRAAPFVELLAEHRPARRAEYFAMAGDLHASAGERGHARRCYRRALEETAPPAAAFLRLALTEKRDGNLREAVKVMEEAHRRFPDQEDLTLGLISLHSEAGQPDKALELLDEFEASLSAAGRRPPPELLVLRASVLDAAKRHADAEKVIRRCLETHPDAHEAMNYLAYTMAERGQNLGEAQKLIEQALVFEPDNAAYVDTLGWVHFQLGRFEPALAALQRAAALAPDDPVIADHVGDALAALGRTGEAVSEWQRSLQLDPGQEKVAAKLRKHGNEPAPVTAAGQDGDP